MGTVFTEDAKHEMSGAMKEGWANRTVEQNREWRSKVGRASAGGRIASLTEDKKTRAK